jgi:hypothetical protein
MCDGFQAVRPDGEKVFVYRRLAWEPAHYEQSADTYEFRWHGIAAGRLTSENTWRRKLRLIFTLDTAGAISEQDLLEISMQIMGRKP